MTATVLMSETLPALVGMHVVSESTKTMFGKRRPSRGRTQHRRADTVTVGNRVYKLYRGERGGKYYVRKGKKVYA
jgi:hypothetical protein